MEHLRKPTKTWEEHANYTQKDPSWESDPRPSCSRMYSFSSLPSCCCRTPSELTPSSISSSALLFSLLTVLFLTLLFSSSVPYFWTTLCRHCCSLSRSWSFDWSVLILLRRSSLAGEASYKHIRVVQGLQVILQRKEVIFTLTACSKNLYLMFPPQIFIRSNCLGHTSPMGSVKAWPCMASSKNGSVVFS